MNVSIHIDIGRARGPELKISDFCREFINMAWKIGLLLQNSLVEVETELNALKDGQEDLIREFQKTNGRRRMKRS
jgi:hypothetical protein